MEEHAITVSGRAAAADWRSALVRGGVGWRDLVLLVMIALMLVGAAPRLTDGFVTLIWSNTRAGVDLRLRHREVHGWFAGTPIYVTERQAVYPPATYVGLASRRLGAHRTTQTVVWLATLVFLSVSGASMRHHDLPSSP